MSPARTRTRSVRWKAIKKLYVSELPPILNCPEVLGIEDAAAEFGLLVRGAVEDTWGWKARFDLTYDNVTHKDIEKTIFVDEERRPLINVPLVPNDPFSKCVTVFLLPEGCGLRK